MLELFHVFFYDPIYNALVFLLSVVPFADVGVAIILLTVLVKLALFPLSIKAVRTQMLVRELEPEMKALKEKYKKDKQEQARKMMELYRDKKLNPFASLLVILIQLPIIIALYFVFFRGGLPVLDEDLLYSFMPRPEEINMLFVGFVDMASKSAWLAALAGVTQFFQARLSLPPLKPKAKNEQPSFSDDFARSMGVQMRYVFPVLMVVVAYVTSAAIALYFVTSNLFAILQELYVRRHVKKPAEKEKTAKTEQIV